MTTSQRISPRERSLIRQAKRVTDDGKLTAAAELYTALLEEFPQSVGGLLGYARAVRNEDVRNEMLNTVLEIEPENEIAKAALRGESLDDLLNPPEPEPEPEPVKATVIDEKPVIHTADGHTFEGEEAVGLRCNRCGKAIDAHNSVHTSVGYRCKECVREIESSYYTASTASQILAFAIALPLATIAAFIVGRFLGSIGFFSWMIAFFASPAIGSAIASFAFRIAGKQRGRYLPSLMSAAMWIGSIIALGTLFLTGYAPLIVLGIFAFTSSGAAYFRVR